MNTAELYSAASETFTYVGNMNQTREDHTAVLLNDGTVLVTGGNKGPGPQDLCFYRQSDHHVTLGWWKRRRRKVMMIGLDCAEPELVFERWLDRLPNIRSLIERGVYGPLRSCDPPITVPAWAVMTSSKKPGTLGVYGFRNRANYSYDEHMIANSTAIKTDRVWDILSRHNKKVILLGIPQTFPPKPVNGVLVGDFLTPDTKSVR